MRIGVSNKYNGNSYPSKWPVFAYNIWVFYPLPFSTIFLTSITSFQFLFINPTTKDHDHDVLSKIDEGIDLIYGCNSGIYIFVSNYC
jgi:hypothetical protein